MYCVSQINCRQVELEKSTNICSYLEHYWLPQIPLIGWCRVALDRYLEWYYFPILTGKVSYDAPNTKTIVLAAYWVVAGCWEVGLLRYGRFCNWRKTSPPDSRAGWNCTLYVEACWQGTILDKSVFKYIKSHYKPIYIATAPNQQVTCNCTTVKSPPVETRQPGRTLGPGLYNNWASDRSSKSS